MTNHLFLVATNEPTGELGHFYVQADNAYVLAGSKVEISAAAVDTNYIPMDEDYDYDLEASDGELDGNILTTPKRGGEITITASSGRREGSTTVYAIEDPTDVVIRDSSGTALTTLNAATGTTTQLAATAAYNHISLKADPEAFTWEVTGDIGTVDEHGLFTAAAPGTGTITVSAGRARVSIPVTVSSSGTVSAGGVMEVESFEGSTTIFRGNGGGLDFSLNHSADTVRLGRGSARVDYTLTEADGDFDKAIEWLREKGLAKAAKKSSRIAAEGMAYATVENGVGVVVEVNAETDFASKTPLFVDFVKDIAKVVAADAPADIEALKNCKYPGSELTVGEMIPEKVMVIGENIQIRRFARFPENFSVAYVHAGGKIGVLVNLEVSGGIDATVIGKDIAMQIAALNPRFWDKSQVSEDVLAEEKKILVAQMDNDEKMASKPLQVKEKIAAGKMNKFFEENCLLQQAFVKDGSVTVEQYMNSAAKALGGSVKFVDAVRFEKGEGIEKKVDDFAAEVAAAAGLAK